MELQSLFLVDSFRSRCQERDWPGSSSSSRAGDAGLGDDVEASALLTAQAPQPLCFWGCALGSCLMNPSLQVRRHVQGHTEIYPRASSHTRVSHSTLAQFDPGVSAVVQHLLCPVVHSSHNCICVPATVLSLAHQRWKAVLLLKLQMNV